MPRRTIGREFDQEDIRLIMARMKTDLGLLDISVSIALMSNNWLMIQVFAWDYNRTPAKEYKTHTTCVTMRGPHLDSTIYQHLMGLYHMVDREFEDRRRAAMN